MTTEEQKTDLLSDFQQYLEKNQPTPFLTGDQPDLNTLLSELTGLKTEVKAESRQFKNTLDSLSSSLDTVQSDNTALTMELKNANERLIQQKEEVMRSMLLELVDIYDYLKIGIDMQKKYRPVNRLFNHSQKKDVRFIKRSYEGQTMTMNRFKKFFQSHQVQEIECLNKAMNPEIMVAVETGKNPHVDNGIVLEELRRGFLYRNEVLRLAEVKVNKITLG